MRCRLCSRLYSEGKSLYLRIVGKGIDCHGTVEAATEDKQRVALVNAAAPGCACEDFRMSHHSPHPVCGSELLFRFIFHPIHFKKGRLNSGVFSQVHDSGCSIQRDIASRSELATFVTNFLTTKQERTWLGVAIAKCKDVRAVTVDDDAAKRAVCVYDTGLESNPAHGELFQSQHVIEEADRAEVRVKLFKAFSAVKPMEFLGGSIWDELSAELRERPGPSVELVPQ